MTSLPLQSYLAITAFVANVREFFQQKPSSVLCSVQSVGSLDAWGCPSVCQQLLTSSLRQRDRGEDDDGIANCRFCHRLI